MISVEQIEKTLDLASVEGISKKLQRQMVFIAEVDKMKAIFRRTLLTDGSRRENDAEHSWHMAVMAYLLKEYANEKIDISKVMLMCLILDIVEIDAGDTYAYDTAGLETQKDREEKAAERIFGMLPEDQKAELKSLFEEFEAYETPEAKFARAMDNFQPLLLNDSNNGGDWKEHGVCRSQIMGRHKKTRLGSEEIGQYSEELIMDNVKKGNIRDE